MNKTQHLYALLDANVLYPAHLRAFLLHLAAVGSFKPKWTHLIHKEWMENLIQKRPDPKRRNLEKTRLVIERDFTEAAISGYENLIEGLILPDQNDRHVPAAAVFSKTELIITFDTKDFPHSYLHEFGIVAQLPGHFVEVLIGVDKGLCTQAL